MPSAAQTALLLALASPFYAVAAEVAVLDNGMRIHAQRVERDGSRVILHTSDTGKIEIDAARLASVEHIDDPIAAAPAPALQPVAALSPEKSVRELVTDAALRYGLPPELVHGVAQAESGYRPSALSPKGAMGIMQLMPDTARKFDADPSDTVQNIDAGAHLLRELLLRYEGSTNGVRRALAAYNAGEGAVARYGGVPPFRETQGYVERVIGLYWKNVKSASLIPITTISNTSPVAGATETGLSSGTN